MWRVEMQAEEDKSRGGAGDGIGAGVEVGEGDGGTGERDRSDGKLEKGCGTVGVQETELPLQPSGQNSRHSRF
jgi:hypothetical protein